MKRKKHTVRFSDSEYQMIKEYARSKGRAVSAFVRHSALSEISKHPPKNGLETMVRQIVQESLAERFPTLGNANEGHSMEKL